MANGTIAFDTLTTSDSVNTGTEKSIDTSYIFNGVSKAWIQLNGSGTIAARDSFNIGSTTDNGTGNYSYAFSNNMNAADYAITTGGNYLLTSFVGNTGCPANTHATSGFDTESYNSVYSSALDYAYVSADIKGDLA